MRTIIVYPLPLDDWATFGPFVRRWTDTYRQFPPGVEHEVWVMCCQGLPSQHQRKMFAGISAKFVHYPDAGCDVGCAQYAALLPEADNAFVVPNTTRVYFHREGWLKRLVLARIQHGDQLYATSTSHEPSQDPGAKFNPHVCVRCYGIDANTFREYPHKIDTRQKCHYFECGRWHFTKWLWSTGRSALLVGWHGITQWPRARQVPNTFRNGDQSDMLVLDKHTDIYRDASPDQKKFLERMADGRVNEF